jgi:hypothetical protein
MEDVDVPTFELFFEWSLMLQPALRDHWTMEQILKLAQLGERYQMFALKNQVVSRIRDCLVSKRWKVTPQLARSLWQISGGNGDHGLYLILNISLGAIPHDADTSQWSAVMKEHPGLYQVHSDACLHKLTLQNLKNIDICVLHDHSWQMAPAGNESRVYSARCPLDEAECYPEGWIERNEEEGRALCCRHDGNESTFADDWRGVVHSDQGDVQSD